jgi:hypothetical protein
MVYSLIDYSLMSTRRPELSTESREAVRRILTAKRTYAVPEAAILLGIGHAALSAEIAAGDIAGLRDGRNLRLPWAEVAYLALRRWPLKAIFDALESETSSLLPALLRPTEFTVSLPTYQVRMLELLAGREQLDASTFLQGQLLDLASASDHGFLEEQIPGLLEALFFPHER